MVDLRNHPKESFFYNFLSNNPRWIHRSLKKELNHIKEIANNINSKLNQPIVKENNNDEVNNEKIEINNYNIINENKLIEQKNKSLNETRQKDAVKVKINIKKRFEWYKKKKKWEIRKRKKTNRK